MEQAISINPSVYQALVIAKGLELYERTGIRINRGYTPKNMMEQAERITGQKFRKNDLLAAAKALRQWAEERHQAPT